MEHRMCSSTMLFVIILQDLPYFSPKNCEIKFNILYFKLWLPLKIVLGPLDHN